MTNRDAFDVDRVQPQPRRRSEPSRPRAASSTVQHLPARHSRWSGGGGYPRRDITRFAEALKNGRWCRSSAESLTTPSRSSSLRTMDRFVIDEGGRVGGHSAVPGINSQLDRYIGEDYTVACGELGGARRRRARTSGR